MQYTITESATAGRSATIFYGDFTPVAVPGTHPKYDEILAALLANAAEDVVRALVDAVKPLREFAALSERVSIRGKKLYFDGDRIKGTVTKHIVRMVKSGDNQVGSLVSFLEKVSTNPSQDSRDALYRWLMDRNFTITRGGDFLAYKGVTREGLSIHSGRAWVDGVEITGHIPNKVGAVVTMPRLRVDDNREVGCSHGLHAGTWGYAHSFAQGMTLTVRINPRDVVSVPDCSEFQKLRVCRYVVIDSAECEYTDPVYSGEEDGSCSGCGLDTEDCICDDEFCKGCSERTEDCTCSGLCEGCGRSTENCTCEYLARTAAARAGAL